MDGLGVVGTIHSICGAVHHSIEWPARDLDGLEAEDGCPAGGVGVGPTMPCGEARRGSAAGGTPHSRARSVFCLVDDDDGGGTG